MINADGAERRNSTTRRVPICKSGVSLFATRAVRAQLTFLDRGESIALTSPSKEIRPHMATQHNRASKAEVVKVSSYYPSPGDTFCAVTAARSLSVRLSSTLCREEIYQGVSHLVVPVIPIYGNLVFWPTGAEGYELVPDYVLAAAPVGWNNRPVVPIHPDISQPTANTPAFLESYCFGQLFNTVYGADNKLHTEAWLNRTLALKVGDLALDVIAKCESGEMVEVSIGAQIAFESRAGEYNGKSYIGIWRGLTPDHLAMGLAGQEGACSIEAGCGGNRLANVKPVPTKPKSKSVYITRNHLARAKGAHPAMAIPNMKQLVGSLLDSIRMSGTPAEDAEEMAELISYSTMRDLVDQVLTKVQSARMDILSLISAETESPTETAESESAEETIEIAKFLSIKTMLLAAAQDIYSATDVVYDLYRNHMEAKELEEAAESGVLPVVIVGDTRYYADGKPADGLGVDANTRIAKGARHSKNDMKMIQSTHDMTIKLGAACDSKNADGETTGETKTATASASGNINAKPCGCHSNTNAPASLF